MTDDTCKPQSLCFLSKWAWLYKSEANKKEREAGATDPEVKFASRISIPKVYWRASWSLSMISLQVMVPNLLTARWVGKARSVTLLSPRGLFPSNQTLLQI